MQARRADLKLAQLAYLTPEGFEEFVAERAPGIAFYSEDRGLVAPAGEPEWVLVVDPIDGTRPAMASVRSP